MGRFGEEEEVSKKNDDLEKFEVGHDVFEPAPWEVPPSPMSDFQVVGRGKDKLVWRFLDMAPFVRWSFRSSFLVSMLLFLPPSAFPA